MRNFIRIVEAAAVPPVDFSALVRRGMEAVKNDLQRHGIDDRFTVKIKGGTDAPRDQKWIGMYRGGSQFNRTNSGAIFWLNANIPKIVAEDYDPDLDREFEIEVMHAIIETLHHEYGHVIEEYVRYHPDHIPELTELIKGFSDMEDFCETFGRTLSGSDPDWGRIKPVITQWIRVLSGEGDA